MRRATEVLYPSAVLHGLDYAELQALGSGSRVIELDEKTPIHIGNEPHQSADELSIERVAFELFAERVGPGMPGRVLCTVLLSFNPRTAQAIDTMLPPHYREEVKAYGRTIARYRWRRRRQSHGVFYSSGSTVDIPDENLIALRAYARQ